MIRSDARKIAETITKEQLETMFATAKEKITDWAKVSMVNKGMTKGVAWNILAKDFSVGKSYHVLAKTNMVLEFGEFLPDGLRIKKPARPKYKVIHQNPKF